MRMKKRLKEETGSMTVYVSVLLISFVFILVGIFTAHISTRKTQLKSILKIKESYELVNKNVETLYAAKSEIVNENPVATITLSSTAALVNNNITATIVQEDNHGINYSKCKYVLNKTSTPIGTSASLYTGGSVSSQNANLSLSSSTAGTYYLHVLTVDKYDNPTETISAPIDIISSSTVSYTTVGSSSAPVSTYTVPADGNYEFDVVGASGSGGNTYAGSGQTYTASGGKGARIVAHFNLKKGDIIDILVGGQGTNVNGTATDGASGGGGGGTFIFKRINSIANSTYQFSKGSINYETLMAVAGGGGSQDVAYVYRSSSSGTSTGYNGQAVGFKSPSNSAAYSTATSSGSSSSSSVMGITQFINYNGIGTTYTRGSSKGIGGFGGGGAADDTYSYGGGWCNGSTTGQAMSWCLDTAASATDGFRTGNGYAKITPKSLVNISTTTSSSKYIKQGLALQYDSIYNTEIGHSSTTPEWKDLSGNGNNGIINGSIVWDNNSLYLDGSSYIKSKNAINFGTKTWEIVFSPQNTASFVLDHRNADLGYQPIYINNGSSTFQYYSSTGGSINTTRTIPQKKQSIAITQDTSTVKIYVNGLLAETHNLAYRETGSGSLYVGTRFSTNTGFFKGYVYAVRVYNRVLNENEISQNYTVDSQKYGLK